MPTSTLKRSCRAGLRAGMLAVLLAMTAACSENPAGQGGSSAVPPNQATVPAERTDPYAQMMHSIFAEDAADGQIDVLFVGDSITDGWRQAGQAVWERHYGSLQAVNFGLSADRTEHVLWRLSHGELEGMRAKVVVLMVGTNNLKSGPVRMTPAHTAEGVASVVDLIRRKQPQAKVLLLGILPRQPRYDWIDRAIAATNEKLAALADDRHVYFLNMNDRFLDEQGDLREPLYAEDRLHLSPAGYAVWADAMDPTLHRLLGTETAGTQPTTSPASQPATKPTTAPSEPNPATVPTSRDDRTYRRDHPRFQRKAARGGFPILFLGDSITEMWLGPGLGTWKKRYRPRDAENFGLSADRTPTMLHRLADGELEGKLDPKVIVLMVGTNNLDSEFCKMTPAQTVGGVRAVLELLARKLPRSRVLLLGLLPREPHKIQLDAKIRRTNELLATLADGKRVVYLDFSDAFRGHDGQADPKMFREDMLHPSPEGYETWGRLMEPTLSKMLAEATSQPAVPDGGE